MDRPLTCVVLALVGLTSCDSIGEPVAPAPVVYRENSPQSASRIMSCFERTGIESYFPGIKFSAIAAGRAGRPDASGYLAKDGTSVAVTQGYLKPTIVSVRAHAPLTELQRGLLAKCVR